MQVTIDTHIHTPLSKCCFENDQTIPNIAGKLAQKGIGLIAITDHFWSSPDIKPNPWYAQHTGNGHLLQIQEIKSQIYPLKVLSSCEADMQAPGKFGITREWKERFDMVLMAADHFQLKDFVEQPMPPTPENIGRLMLRFFRSAVTSGLADILAHPLFSNGYECLYDQAIDRLTDSELFDALSLAQQHGVGLEINCGVLRCAENGKFNLDTMLRIFSLAKQAGCKFTFGSDAHAWSDFERYSLAENFSARLQLTVHDLHPLVASY